jgi:hypothetical protein
VVQLVDSLNLTTNVELGDGLVQELDGRVFRVTAEDELAFLLPKIRGKKSASARPTKSNTRAKYERKNSAPPNTPQERQGRMACRRGVKAKGKKSKRSTGSGKTPPTGIKKKISTYLSGR